MKTAIAKLRSADCPYSQSKHYEVEKLDKESSDAYERRTWRERLHCEEDEKDNGRVLIPPMSFKNCLAEAAKYLSISIPGKGKATYTKHFEAGVLVLKPLVLPLRKQEVKPEILFVPSDGRAGGGKRVTKFFPFIKDWAGEVEFLIFDETITEDIFTKVLEEAGKFIGIGRFRPRNRGFYGRFYVDSVTWL